MLNSFQPLTELVERNLKQSLQNKSQGQFSYGAKRLKDAMEHSLLTGGKRLRPLLTLKCAEVCSEDLSVQQAHKLAMPSALAIEYVHTYSLIHDDLPSMDNDDFRRGKPSCHKAFDEATAILAGDALLSDAFALVAGGEHRSGQLCMELSHAIGGTGMVCGQMNDIARGLGQIVEMDWLDIHRLKTGKLFECACVLGAMSVNASSHSVEAMRSYGAALGLAFQLADDVLDDAHLVQERGGEKVAQLAKEFSLLAISQAGIFGERGMELQALAKFAVERKA